MSPATTAASVTPLNPDCPSSVSTMDAHRLICNSALSLAALVWNAAFNLVVVFYLAHSLNRAAVGEFYVFVTFVAVFQLVGEAGTGTVLTYRLVRGQQVWEATVAEGARLFALIALWSAALLLSLGGLWSWITNDQTIWHRGVAGAVACAAIQAQRFCTAVFRASEQFGYEAMARFLQGAVLAGLVAVLAGVGWLGLQWAAYIFAASHVLAAVFLLGCLRRRCGWTAWRPLWRGVKGWLMESAPLGMGDLESVP